MNLKVLFLLLVYYGIIGLIFATSDAVFTDEGFTTDINLNDSSLTSNETGTGGLFNQGISFGRWFGLVFFGVGLPDSTPAFFSSFFIVWQSIITVFGIGWVVSSIWDG